MDKSPRLDLKHGFLRSIRHRLYKNQSAEVLRTVTENRQSPEVTKSASEPSLAVTDPENNESDLKPRRRASRQLYCPPHRRDRNQDKENGLRELKSFEERGESDTMPGIIQKNIPATRPHRIPSLVKEEGRGHEAVTQDCGMPLSKSVAQTDLVSAGRIKSEKSRKTRESGETTQVNTGRGDGSSGKFGYLLQVFVTDIAFNEIDIDGFPETAKRYIFEAYHDPNLVAAGPLENVARVIAERAWTDDREGGYQRIAAQLCQRIAKKEYDREEGMAEPTLTFQRSILDTVYQTFRHRSRLAAQSSRQWSAYVVFCSDILRRFHFGKCPPTVLCHLMFSIVERLCSSQCVESVQGVAVLTEVLARCGLLLHAENEPRLTKAVNRLREKLLDPETDGQIRLNVLLVIELQASNWTLSARNRRFYLDV